MRIQTPYMIAREILTDAGVTISSYLPNIKRGIITMKGSATTLQDDFADWVITPDDTFTRNSANRPAVEATSVTISPGSNQAIGANDDVLFVYVAKPNTSATIFGASFGQIIPSTQAGIQLGYADSSGRCGAFESDSLGGLVEASAGATASKLSGATAANVHAHVVSYDNSGDFDGTFYDLDNSNEVLSSGSATHNRGAITPNTITNIQGATELYGYLYFLFGSDGLPSTWEADGLAIANAIKRYQES